MFLQFRNAWKSPLGLGLSTTYYLCSDSHQHGPSGVQTRGSKGPDSACYSLLIRIVVQALEADPVPVSGAHDRSLVDPKRSKELQIWIRCFRVAQQAVFGSFVAADVLSESCIRSRHVGNWNRDGFCCISSSECGTSCSSSFRPSGMAVKSTTLGDSNSSSQIRLVRPELGLRFVACLDKMRRTLSYWSVLTSRDISRPDKHPRRSFCPEI